MNVAIKDQRRPRRRGVTRELLIDKAEALFAEQGIEGVSLRQIGAAIGSGNTNVVTYHFGSKEALVRAIFEHRLQVLEARRAEALARADREGNGQDARVLLDAMFRPLFEQLNLTGKRSFSAFLEGVMRSDRWSVRRTLTVGYPVTTMIGERLAIICGLPLDRRFAEIGLILMAMILKAGQLADQGGYGSARAEQLFKETIGMMEAALKSRGKV